MAEMKLEEMLKIIRNENLYSEDCYKKAVVKGWYTDDAPGKAQYFSDINTVALPPAPVAAPAPTTAAPTPAAAPANYGAMHLYQKQMLLADLEMTQYKKDQELIQKEQTLNQENCEYGQSFRFWRNIAIPTIAAGALALFGRSEIPSKTIDETVAQYEIQKQEVDVQDYMRTHEGKSPPWQKSPEKIRMETTKDYTLEKSTLYGIGIIGILGGIISGIASAIYLGLSKRK